MAHRILLVEDNPQIREIIEDYFVSKESEVLEITSADDGIEVEEIIETTEFDLILLDVMLPHLDGFSICRKIRRTSDVPVIFLTARSSEDDILFGYELGCDDYVTKPFSVAELYAKSMALLRRAKGTVRNSKVSCGEIELDTLAFECFVNGRKVALAPKEYELLSYLIANKNKVISREVLLERIWGYDFDGGTRVVDNHIKKLRSHLGEARNHISTVISKGYKITD